MDKAKWIIVIIVALLIGIGVAVKVFDVPHTPGTPPVGEQEGPAK